MKILTGGSEKPFMFVESLIAILQLIKLCKATSDIVERVNKIWLLLHFKEYLLIS